MDSFFDEENSWPYLGIILRFKLEDPKVEPKPAKIKEEQKQLSCSTFRDELVEMLQKYYKAGGLTFVDIYKDTEEQLLAKIQSFLKPLNQLK